MGKTYTFYKTTSVFIETIRPWTIKDFTSKFGESGVTQSSKKISVRIREDINLRKEVSYRKKDIIVKYVGLNPMLL
jgi:hypothetical protein